MNFTLKFKEQANSGTNRYQPVKLEILIKPRKLDKINKRIKHRDERKEVKY